jgi:lipopolysaccharide/colanic/teichoic acid biosynthesis glycosyltransferase
MLLRREAMPAQGPFDERYFLYFEDVDLCRRMRATGRTVVFEPDALVTHSFGAASRNQVPWNPLLWQHALSGLLYLHRWNAGWWSLRSVRTLVHGGGRALLRCLLLSALGMLLLPTGQAVAAATLATLLLPLQARPTLGRRPLPSLGSLAAAVAASAIGTALLTEGSIAPTVLPQLGLWCLASLPALHVLDRALRGISATLAGAGIGHRACLLAGDPATAERVACSLREQPEEGLHVAGFVPLDPAAQGGPHPRISCWDDIAEQAQRLRVDSVLLCGSAEQLSRMTAGVVALRQIGVDPAFVLTGAEELLQSEAPRELAGRALLPLGSGLGSQVGLRVARATEWSLAALGLMLLAPLAPLLLTASVLSSGRSPLLRARRIGLDLTSFEMLRLRSGPGPLGDEGGGWLGRLLRWSHADELPQLINVLRGEMALVGPRPVAPQTADRLDEWQRARFSVRPGITGIWQLDRLRRWRLEQMIASDLLYVLRRSPAMDLRLLGQTLLGRRNP